MNTKSPSDRDPIVPFAALLISAASLMMVLWNLQDASLKNANTGSRYATVESLVDYGTYSIDQSRYRRTIDKVKVGEHYYSSKPPVLPTYAAGVYWVYRKLTGHSIALYEGEVVWLGSLFTGWLSHFVLLLYVIRLGKLLYVRKVAQVGTVAAVAFAYLGAGYATTLNNHSVAAALAVAGFTHVLLARSLASRRRDWIWAGLFLGLLPSMDLPSGALLAALALCLWIKDSRRTLQWFVPAVILPVGVHLALTYLSTGSLIPAYARKELYDYPGSYWLHEQGIDGLREAKSLYAFHMLLGHHGLFSMTPLLVLGAVGLRRAASSSSGNSSDESVGEREVLHDRPVAIAVAAACCVMVAFLVVQTHNYGGWCVGMRWLVPVMALLFVYFGVWLDKANLTRGWVAALAVGFCISAYNTQDALSGPFQFSRWHNFVEGKPNRNRTGDKKNLGVAHARAAKQRRRPGAANRGKPVRRAQPDKSRSRP